MRLAKWITRSFVNKAKEGGYVRIYNNIYVSPHAVVLNSTIQNMIHHHKDYFLS